MTIDELVQFLRQGGITLAGILLASVVALGVSIERLMALWGVSAQARTLGQTVAKHLLRGEPAAAEKAAERSSYIVADLFRAGFERAAKTKGPSLDAAVDRERSQLLLKLKSKLWILGTIGATTPFVGLFGTVVGIMRSFRELGIDVTGGGAGGPGAVMAGISEALVATAAGIIVAVEAVIFYNYFQSRLSKLSIELRLISEEFVELLREGVNGNGGNGLSATETPATTSTPAQAIPAKT